MNTFFDQIFCEQNNSYSIIIEDDGKVCYAYLMENNKIIGDVWLYNTVLTPSNVDWSSEAEMPFLNPLVYIDPNKTIKPIDSSTDIKIDWVMKEKELQKADIHINSRLIARVKPGHKPGWSIIVLKDGPLAKTLK